MCVLPSQSCNCHTIPAHRPALLFGVLPHDVQGDKVLTQVLALDQRDVVAPSVSRTQQVQECLTVKLAGGGHLLHLTALCKLPLKGRGEGVRSRHGGIIVAGHAHRVAFVLMNIACDERTNKKRLWR